MRNVVVSGTAVFLKFYLKPDSLETAHNRTLNEWQLLTDAPNPTNDRNVGVSGKSAFVAYGRKAALRCADEQMAGNDYISLPLV